MAESTYSPAFGIPATHDAFKLLRLMTALEGTIQFDIEDLMPMERWEVATAVGAGPLFLGAAFSGALTALREDGISIAGALTAPIPHTDEVSPNDISTATDWLASGLAMGDDQLMEQAVITNSVNVIGVAADPIRLAEHLAAIAHAAGHIHAFGR